jgi:TonB family protein
VGSNFPRWFFDYSTVEWETIYPVFVRDLEELDEAPKVLEQASPVYPEEMRRKEIDGDVLVELIISTSGEVDQAIILESNHPDFSLSAKAAVLKWKFLPGKIANMPVYVRARIPIIFRFSR